MSHPRYYDDGRLATTIFGSKILYDAEGRPHLVGGEARALLESIAFQIGKDEGLSRAEALREAKRRSDEGKFE
jgi:hypothetical protein